MLWFIYRDPATLLSVSGGASAAGYFDGMGSLHRRFSSHLHQYAFSGPVAHCLAIGAYAPGVGGFGH